MNNCNLSEHDYQGLWDQLLARGWIEGRPWQSVWHNFWWITGFNPSDERLQLQRVLMSFDGKRSPPVRALIAQQWPKLSTWLFAWDHKKLRTPEGEQAIICEIEKRDARPKLSKNKKAVSFRVKNKVRAVERGINRAKARSKYDPNHDWKTIKSVRAKG